MLRSASTSDRLPNEFYFSLDANSSVDDAILVAADLSRRHKGPDPFRVLLFAPQVDYNRLESMGFVVKLLYKSKPNEIDREEEKIELQMTWDDASHTAFELMRVPSRVSAARGHSGNVVLFSPSTKTDMNFMYRVIFPLMANRNTKFVIYNVPEEDELTNIWYLNGITFAIISRSNVRDAH